MNIINLIRVISFYKAIDSYKIILSEFQVSNEKSIHPRQSCSQFKKSQGLESILLEDFTERFD